MSELKKKGNTSVRVEDGSTIVRYHDTDVVKFNNKVIVLNTGGWFSATTKDRMNTASFEFNLGYKVAQVKGEWVVTYNGEKLHMKNSMLFLLRR